MKSLIKLSACFVFSLSLISNQLSANHAAGGSITYSHLTGNTFQISVTLYRDCAGDASPLNITVHISSIQCGLSDSVILAPLPGTGQEFVICTNAVTTCNGGTDRGIQIWEYESSYNFPTQCNDWLMSTVISGRSAGITTIQHPATTDLYLEARLNNSMGDNSSPQISNPIFSILTAQQTVLNFGFIDPDGDSLAFMLTPARSEVNTNVSYIPPYSGIDPLSSIPPVTIDPVSGDIVCNATSPESAVLVCQVNEFRNGILIGSVMIDINITTVNEINQSPQLYGWGGQFIFYAGPGLFCLTFYSDDTNVDDTLTMIGNLAGTPSATFYVVGDYHPTGTYCWSPDSSDVRPQPYTFSISIHDDGCPLNGASIYSFIVYVTLDTTLINTSVPNLSFETDKNIVVPNPFQQQAEIHLSKFFANIESHFSVFDVMGNLVDSRIVNDSSIQIIKGKLRPGIYLFELKNQIRRASGKLIIE